MKAFWWESGIQIEPESPKETEALKVIWDGLKLSQSSDGKISKSSTPCGPDKDLKVGIANESLVPCGIVKYFLNQ